MPCPKCGGDLRRYEEQSPAWLVAEGLRRITVLSCVACGFVGIEGVHPRCRLSKRAVSHLRAISAAVRDGLSEGVL